MFAGILLYIPKHNFTSRSLLSPFCPLCSSCVSSVAPLTTKRYPPLQEKIFGLSIFLFAQNWWRAVMKNGNLYDTLTAGEVSRRLTKKPPFVSVAIKVRAEQTCLFCRTAATKRSEAHLKEGFGEDYKYNGKARNMSLTCRGLLRNLFSA